MSDRLKRWSVAAFIELGKLFYVGSTTMFWFIIYMTASGQIRWEQMP